MTLALVSGEKLEGYPSTLGFSTQEAEKHSLSVYPGLFLCPDKEDWTIQNLGAARTEFSTSEKIACVLEATSDIPSNDGSVSILAVIHDADGKVVDLEESSAVWKDMWTNKKCTGSFPRTPQTPGKYTLSIYFNRKVSTTEDFTVKASGMTNRKAERRWTLRTRDIKRLPLDTSSGSLSLRQLARAHTVFHGAKRRQTSLSSLAGVTYFKEK